MFIIKHRIKFFIFSSIVVLFSIFSMFFWGLNLGIEFTGGSIIEINYINGRPDSTLLTRGMEAYPFGTFLVQPTGEDGYIIRTKELSSEGREALLTILSIGGEKEFTEERYSLIGPSMGGELMKKAWIAVVLVVLGIIFFVAYAFRKVSGSALTHVETKTSSWHYGMIAIVALLHDVIVPTGIFAFLGSRFVDAQIDILFMVAILTILGYSVNDTIIVFDRVRENLRKNQELKLRKSFEETVGESLSQTYARSINTSLTTLLVVLALYFIGGAATQNFALVLAIGVVAGTYSSLFLAAPLLTLLGRKSVASDKR